MTMIKNQLSSSNSINILLKIYSIFFKIHGHKYNGKFYDHNIDRMIMEFKSFYIK